MFYCLLSTYISFNIPQEPCEVTKEDMIYFLVSEMLCDFIMAKWLFNSQTQGFNSSALDKPKPPKFSSSQQPGGQWLHLAEGATTSGRLRKGNKRKDGQSCQAWLHTFCGSSGQGKELVPQNI